MIVIELKNLIYFWRNDCGNIYDISRSINSGDRGRNQRRAEVAEEAFAAPESQIILRQTITVAAGSNAEL